MARHYEMNGVSVQRDASDGPLPEKLEAYYGTIEARCEHLEEIVNATSNLLRVVINDFASPSLKPILGSVIERVNSIAAYMETALDSTPNSDTY